MMRTLRVVDARAMWVLLLAVPSCPAQAQAQPDERGLAGSAWQLVRFQGGDDTTLTPDDRTKYTIEFGRDGSLVARIDCNRGRGTWTSAGPGQVQFGPLALTRAQCPPGSLHDQIVKQWSSVRSYVQRNGRLFLSLMADGGTYEFEPMAAPSNRPRSPVAFKGPVTYQCRAADGGNGVLRATFYQTTPPMVLVERGAETRPAFGVVAASGAKYEGPDIIFWEARGEVSLTWSGAQSTCAPR